MPAKEMPQCTETERPRGFHHLPFVLNVSLYSVKLFPKQSTRFKIKDTFISSTVDEISTLLKKQAPKYISKFIFLFCFFHIDTVSSEVVCYIIISLTMVYYLTRALTMAHKFQNSTKRTKKKSMCTGRHQPVKTN